MKTFALTPFLAARSVAVIGASTNAAKVGHQIFRNLHLNNEHAYPKKKLYPINSDGEDVLGHKGYATIAEIKNKIELVIIVTPAPTVPDLVDQLITRNSQLAKINQVQAVVIITAGFAETSKEGGQTQHMIATKLSLAGIHLLGPNTLGCLHPANHLNASFAQQFIPAGNIALISQSGAMLTALFNAVEQRGVGVSFAVSLGNKAGINENDCLEYALHDPLTQVVVMYVESFSHIPRFFELASRITKKKPLLVLKGGTSERGQQASASHTAALATNQVLLSAAAEQMGFILVKNIEELTNLAFFFAEHRHAPEHIMVITNAGGPAVNTIDLLANSHVSLAGWSDKSAHQLQHSLPFIPVHNPLDLLGDAGPDRFQLALETAQHDVNIDAMVVIITPQAVTNIPGVVETLIAIKGKKPMFVALVGGDQLETHRQKLRQHHILCVIYPNDLTDMLQYMSHICEAKYAEETFYPSEAHVPSVAPISLKPQSVTKKVPSITDAFGLLKKADIAVPRFTVVADPQTSNFSSLKYPLFAKTANLTILHKKEVGAVYGVVENVTQAQAAYEKLQQFGNEVLFQELIDIDHEILVGLTNDPQFGLFLTIGIGGSYTNILADRVYIFLPTHKKRLGAAWKKTKAYEAIKKIPGVSEKIVDVMFSLQKIVMTHPEIKDLEINPLVINKTGAWAADIKLSLK